MYYRTRLASKVDPDFYSGTVDIIDASFRSLIYTFIGISLFGYLLTNLTTYWVKLPQVTALLFMIAIISLVSYLFIPKSLLAAQITWLVGICLTITVAIKLLGIPQIAYLYSFLPLLGAITLSWQWGGVVLLMIFGLVLIPGDVIVVTPLHDPMSIIILAGGAIGLAIGSTIVQSLMTNTQWAVTNYIRADKEMEFMRTQRQELMQIQSDYALANKELARLTDRLEAMQQIAEESRRTKEEFVANVSHELRTPLNMILGFSEIIMKSPQVYGDSIPQALLADIAAIERNSQHLAKLVDDVLDLSQIEAGKMALSKEWASIQQIVNEAVVAVGALFESKGLYLTVEAGDDLPAVFCDTTRIRQVVINLLGNAGRFTEVGGVNIRMWAEKDQIVVSVTDTGTGISTEDQNRIFQPFQQVGNFLRHHKGGSGLGLSISKQFIEMHGGKMWLESTLDHGTTFFFAIPNRVHVSIDAIGGEDEARRWFNPYFEYEPRTRRANLPMTNIPVRYVLLEEENTLDRYFHRYLESVEICSVRSIEDAIEELRRSPAQALIINLPGAKESVSIRNHLADIPFGTPVILCWIPGKGEAARKLGVFEYMIKPVSRQDIDGAIQRLNVPIKTILVVDDDPEILQLITRMFTINENHYQILQAMNGQRALQIMRKRKPDLILMDLMMPGMDGFEVLEEKRTDPTIRDIPVFAVSSRNPVGETVISDMMTVYRGNGLSIQEVLSCIQNLGSVLAPSGHTADPGHAKSPSEQPVS
jgi:signal transduction histidine kinase/ActR/RegA family two-component response regulator